MAALSADTRRRVARKARLVQSYPPDHPKILEVERDLATLRLEKYIKRVLDEAPELAPDQYAQLAELLRPVR